VEPFTEASSHPFVQLGIATLKYVAPLGGVTETTWLGKLPELVVKLHEIVLGFTVQLPVPLPLPTLKFTWMFSGDPVEGVTVTVP
jgi:hypothetical protein